MDGFVLGVFLFAAFVGGFASGLAGFAMGFVVSAIWLYVITPIQTAVLIAGYGLCAQGYGVWMLRQTLRWQRVTPFIIGGTIGVPLGAALLTHVSPTHVRFGVGVLLVIWCQMRGWTKDEQRAVFQPVILTGMMMIAISLSFAGAITKDTLKLYVIGLPALLAGLW